MKKTLVSLAAIVMLASCSDNDTPEPQKPADEYAFIGWDMKFSDEDDSSFFRITYNTDSTVKETKEWDKNDGDDQTFWAYASYLDGKITTLEGKYGAAGTKETDMSYFYKDGRLVRITYYSNGNAPYYKDTLVYNADGRITEMHSEYADEQQAQWNDKKYLLTWAGSNVSKVDMYRKNPNGDGTFQLESTETYTYGSSPNLLAKILKDEYLWKTEPISFDFLSANNVTKMEEVMAGTTEKKVSTITYTYDDDSKLAKLTNLRESYSGTTLNSTYTATIVLRYVKK